MTRRVIGLALTVLLVLGVVAYCTEPPRLLSIADVAYGGGRGADRPGSAIPFGVRGQTLDVWRPATPGKKPVLIFYYGGGWVHGDRRAYAFAARAFARAGFVVVVPDYRKVPGVRFPAFLQDAAEAVKWSRDHIAEYDGDPNRVALAGHSAGAYAAVMLALDRRWLEAEGVDPGIVKASIGMSGPYDFYPFTKKRSIDAMQGVKAPLTTQPIHFARADVPPMLLITSSEDTQVRPYNAVNLTKKLRSLGAPVEFRNYAGLSHEAVVMALSQPFRTTAPTLADSVTFLTKAMPEGR
ncbi:MAG TPA: alpha/beta hydrolase [Sphingomicrobium sp.]